MVRALTTLVGLAAAAAILYFVSDVGDSGGSYWTRALLWAAAGLVLGILYQAGGRRSPGVRANTPMLVLAFLPWTVLSAALVAVIADNPTWLSDRARDVLPDSWITRWEISLPAFAFGSGLLLAFSLIEPRVGQRELDAVDSANAPVTAWEPPPPRPAPVDPPTAVLEAPAPIVDEPTDPVRPSDPPTMIDEPAPVVESQREARLDD
jgi:hypothetical protein